MGLIYVEKLPIKICQNTQTNTINLNIYNINIKTIMISFNIHKILKNIYISSRIYAKFLKAFNKIYIGSKNF